MDLLKRKKRKAGTKPTVEQEIRKIDLKTKKLAHKFLVEEAKVNPAVKLQLIEREFGIKIPVRDAVKEAKERILETIVDEAVYTVEHNPRLTEKLSRGLINKYAADLGIPTNDAPKTQLERDLLLVEHVRKMKEGLGIKDTHSFWDTLNNPQVAVVGLGLIGQLASMIRPDLKPSKIIYVAEVDGKDTEMTEEEFREFKLKRAMAKITSENGTLAAATLSGAAQKATSGDGYQPGDDIQCVFVPPLKN